MSGRTIRVGTRDSALAMRQTTLVTQELQAANPDLCFEVIALKTLGDKVLDTRLDVIGGKGLFIKELEQALLAGDIDLAVHSYKDMPYEDTPGLAVVALSAREAPFDVLVLPSGITELDWEKPLGTSSQRRAVQLAALYPGLAVSSVRGNVLTRIAKLDRGEFAGLVLAQAGLIRMGLEQRISRVFSIDEMLPSGGQGILALQGRQDEDYGYLDGLHNITSQLVSRAERSFLRCLGADCASPVGAYASLTGQELLLKGLYVDKDGLMHKGEMRGSASLAVAVALGEALAARITEEVEGS